MRTCAIALTIALVAALWTCPAAGAEAKAKKRPAVYPTAILPFQERGSGVEGYGAKVSDLLFASLVISLFYSAKFAEAVEVLRWICLGVALRVITWPIGFIIVAKNRQLLFLATEIAWTAVNVGLTWLCVGAYGLNGAGIAFFLSYVFHGLMIAPIVHHLTGFRWSGENLRTGLFFIASIGAVFAGFNTLPANAAIALGCMMMVALVIVALCRLQKLITPEQLPTPFRRLVNCVRFGLSAFDGRGGL